MSFYKNSGSKIKLHIPDDSNSDLKEIIEIGEFRSVPEINLVYECVPYQKNGCSECVFSIYRKFFKQCKTCCQSSRPDRVAVIFKIAKL